MPAEDNRQAGPLLFKPPGDLDDCGVCGALSGKAYQAGFEIQNLSGAIVIDGWTHAQRFPANGQNKIENREVMAVPWQGRGDINKTQGRKIVHGVQKKWRKCQRDSHENLYIRIKEEIKEQDFVAGNFSWYREHTVEKKITLEK